MGNLSAAAYDMAVGVGFASFQAAVGQPGLAADALHNAQLGANVLAAHHVIRQHNLEALTDYQAIVTARQSLEDEIRAVNNVVANVYRLATDISLAEAQTTSPDFAKGVDFAHTGLLQASQVVQQNFHNIGLDQGLLNDAISITQNFGAGRGNTHTVVETLRTSWRDTILRSALP
jgi:hypothetical protein